MNREQLEQEEKDLLSKLSKNRELQRDLNVKEFTERHGFKIGDSISFLDGKQPKKGVISRIEAGKYSGYYFANTYNSDNKPGKREVRIWDVNSIQLLNMTEDEQ